ncbi:hypothetical protein WUBG_03240 [Wuchereria bancrofti]|uniref:Uncharacterized protein n=1 Tax=Wuchereria bancrofti TaxID=6293 RepID=J9EUJ9_WUCBA|nr:hypothetical protein WUBG_03240 [Wuchereria bancrofti]
MSTHYESMRRQLWRSFHRSWFHRLLRDRMTIRLHKRVISAVQNHHRKQAQWNALIFRALYLEDVQQAEMTGQFVRTKEHRSYFFYCPSRVCFLWHVLYKRTLLKIYATVIISYLCICAYYTVFKLQIYRYYHLDPHHMTDENSLLFSAILLCRLTPPICLNVLGMIHLDSHITSDTEFGVETQFTKLMGHLDLIPVLAKGINIYLPILIVLLALGTWFKLGIRLLHFLGIDQFVDDDEMTVELVNGGKARVSLERNKIMRAAYREERDQYWGEKLTMKTASDHGALRGGISSSQPDYRFPGTREYSDREPIMTADNAEEYSSFDLISSGNYEFSGAHPPPNMFDDL